MKFGILVGSLANSFNEPVNKYIQTISELGFDGVEISLIDIDTFNIKETKNILNSTNLGSTFGTSLLKNADISSDDISIRQNGKDRLRKCIDISLELGGESLNGILYGQWGKVRTSLTENPQIGYENVVESLSSIANEYKNENFNLCLECINRYETSFLNTVDQGVSLINDINRDNVKIHLDTFHMNIEEKNIVDSIGKSKDILGHFHCADNNRGYPGDGSLNFLEIIKELQKIKYNKWVNLECFVDSNNSVGLDTFTWIDKSTDKFKSAKASLELLKKYTEV